MTRHSKRRCVSALAVPALSLGLLAATGGSAGAAELDGARLGVIWAIPFVGVLLSIAVLPLLAARQLIHGHDIPGASMLLIRPAAARQRHHRKHSWCAR
jgi:hypothetical protein